MLVRLDKYLLPGPGIRTVGGDTAVRRQRSPLGHASPENPPGLGPCGVSAPNSSAWSCGSVHSLHGLGPPLDHCHNTFHVYPSRLRKQGQALLVALKTPVALSPAWG